MIRLASSPAPSPTPLARSALAMLNSTEFLKEPRRELPGASAAVLDVLRDWAAGDSDGERGRHAPPASHPARQVEARLPDYPLDIAITDWDLLFRAVMVRLMLGVGEKLAAAPRSQAGEAAEMVQSIVLECVDALHQLHLALMRERAERDHPAAAAPGMRASRPAALDGSFLPGASDGF
jgi:hypothetical protein